MYIYIAGGERPGSRVTLVIRVQGSKPASGPVWGYLVQWSGSSGTLEIAKPTKP